MDIDTLASSSSTWINALHLVLTEISLTQNQDHKMSAIWFYFLPILRVQFLNIIIGKHT
jgi:hypothetical protein